MSSGLFWIQGTEDPTQTAMAQIGIYQLIEKKSQGSTSFRSGLIEGLQQHLRVPLHLLVLLSAMVAPLSGRLLWFWQDGHQQMQAYFFMVLVSAKKQEKNKWLSVESPSWSWALIGLLVLIGSLSGERLSLSGSHW